jgi:hypothetical protein
MASVEPADGPLFLVGGRRFCGGRAAGGLACGRGGGGGAGGPGGRLAVVVTDCLPIGCPLRT